MIDIIGTPNLEYIPAHAQWPLRSSPKCSFFVSRFKSFWPGTAQGGKCTALDATRETWSVSGKKITRIWMHPSLFFHFHSIFFLNFKILICDKMQADSAMVVLLGSLWTSWLRAWNRVHEVPRNMVCNYDLPYLEPEGSDHKRGIPHADTLGPFHPRGGAKLPR